MKPTSIRAILASLAVSVASAPLLTSPLAAQDTNAVVEPDFEADNDPFICGRTTEITVIDMPCSRVVNWTVRTSSSRRKVRNSSIGI